MLVEVVFEGPQPGDLHPEKQRDAAGADLGDLTDAGVAQHVQLGAATELAAVVAVRALWATPAVQVLARGPEAHVAGLLLDQAGDEYPAAEPDPGADRVRCTRCCAVAMPRALASSRV